MRDHIPVVVQGSGRRARRAGLAGALWAAAELIVTAGVVVLLLVVHQVWWTNRQALAAARDEVHALERSWAEEPAVRPTPAPDPPPGEGATPAPEDAPESAPQSRDEPGSGVEGSPGTGPGPGSGGSAAAGRGVEPPARDGSYAILRIPRLGVVVPVAQGIDKRAVLDKGYAGHYPGTAAPGARGNFALAGHRNTHGEPFRYINRLRAGDELIVDVRGERYTYVVGKALGQTTERDTGVIAPVPRSVVRPDQGYTEPGAYITLTTCTPEYTSRYRLVVWGTLRR
ncbi:class E sortase [Streptomyces sp. H27-H5]|uniref:class E sortase n=1 Tax=Streptomyces sp. H27-H5 TaxID=2996460 RepID=UPI0022722982|nr:class E sortase [Streptomyces sp. H27-H5]MCY0961035.1 class E sortase [Streptomyces sp. H27-H5]